VDQVGGLLRNWNIKLAYVLSDVEHGARRLITNRIEERCAEEEQVFADLRQEACGRHREVDRFRVRQTTNHLFVENFQVLV